jgi:glycine/D-amino acid oxidase-like deaminating enzyme
VGTERAHETRPVEQSCFWLATRKREPDPPLEGHRETEIAIVGAGFTGLWTANFLKALDPRTEIVVLEQSTAAYGASGRNAGMLGETIDHTHELAVAHFGHAEARNLARLGKENVEKMLDFLTEHEIECDVERSGHLHVALSPGQFEELRSAAACAHELGMSHYRLLDGPEVRGEIHSARYQGGLLNPNGAILNPVKLVEGLKREASRAGVTFFEGSRVTGIESSGSALRLRTPSGELTARKAIVGTNAYTHYLLPRLKHRFIPLYDYILVSEPLTPEQKEAIGWRHRQGVADARTFFKYYRLTADDRILWGTSEAAYYPGNRVDASCDHSDRHYQELRESFRRHFPALGDLGFPYAWGGPICSTTRFTPFFGSTSRGRIFYGLGYTGHGLGTTHLAGKILAHMALGRSSPLLDLPIVRRKPLPYPPEPLRSLAVAAVTKALRRVDAGGRPSLLLRLLDAMGIGLSS